MDAALLQGLRVLDLTQHIAGPTCTKLLAGFGAEVIKVEPPGVGDVSRRLGPFPDDVPHPEKSGAFLIYNTGKKSVTLRLGSPTASEIVRKLVSHCDMLVEDFLPGYLSKEGLGYEDLRRDNPRLVYLSLTGYGQRGPYADYQGADIVYQAVGGLMYPIGLPEREPLRIGGDPTLFTTGVSAFSAAMLALLARDVQGHGQHVDVSSIETTAVTQIHASITSQFSGEDVTRRRNTLLPTKDGWGNPGLGLGIREDTWRRFAEMTGVPGLAEDPRFSTPAARRENQADLDALIRDWTASQPKEELYHTLQGMSTIAGYVANVDDLLKSRQLMHRKSFQELDHPAAGKALYPGAPVEVDGVRPPLGRAPLLGEHNAEVYGGLLGYTARDLAILASLGVV